jgi:hypothetical protein
VAHVPAHVAGQTCHCSCSVPATRQLEATQSKSS